MMVRPGMIMVPGYTSGAMVESCGERFLHPYREAVRRFGPGFQATLWSSPEAQRIRFDVMIELADLGGRTVVDAGCGPGGFAERLIERSIPFERYVGIDGLAEMIEAARRKNLPGCEFIIADLLRDPCAMTTARPEYVCVSGTLNTMEEPVARRFIELCFDAATIGVVFNFLSDRAHVKWHDRDIGPARRFNTLEWIDWALQRTSLVSFAQDYLEGHDATLHMRRE